MAQRTSPRQVEWDWEGARRRIADLTWVTPVVPLAGRTPPVYAKLENLQHSGSFKIRGAVNCLSTLSDAQRARGVVACSSGNHGRAVAEAARALGVRARICVPDWADPTKVAAIRRAGAELVSGGPTYDEAEARVERLAREQGLTIVHPFDDPRVIEGQGTVALELLEQVPEVTEVLVPLSGGGLVGGIAAALEGSGVEVVAVSAERASVMHQSVLAGKPASAEEEPTLASALSGGIGLENKYTFDLVRGLVDRFLVVPEAWVRRAVARVAMDLKLVVEGGGAVALAALWSGYQPAGPAAVVVSGGNLDLATLAEVVDEYRP